VSTSGGKFRLSWSDQDTVIQQWHELMEFPASSPQEALEHCLRALARQIGAVNATWVGAAREKDWERRNPLRSFAWLAAAHLSHASSHRCLAACP